MVVIGIVWLLTTATLTYAAGEKLTTPVKKPVSVATPRPTLVVPDIRGQAFVFAKGILEDAGFAWRVEGGVKGFSTNVVSLQQPAPGTRVEDTGAPTLTLTMRGGTYPEAGMPENTSPYAGTSIVLPKSLTAPAKKLTAPKVPVVGAKKAVKPKAKPSRVITPKRKIAKKIAKTKPTLTRARRSAFGVPGAPKEPLSEIPLTTRARRLSTWLTTSRRATAMNERYWLYQHAWIVTGARFGWWHGAAALRLLISVDRRVESQWGIGRRSESVARGALAAAEAKAK